MSAGTKANDCDLLGVYIILLGIFSHMLDCTCSILDLLGMAVGGYGIPYDKGVKTCRVVYYGNTLGFSVRARRVSTARKDDNGRTGVVPASSMYAVRFENLPSSKSFSRKFIFSVYILNILSCYISVFGKSNETDVPLFFSLFMVTP